MKISEKFVFAIAKNLVKIWTEILQFVHIVPFSLGRVTNYHCHSEVTGWRIWE